MHRYCAASPLLYYYYYTMCSLFISTGGSKSSSPAPLGPLFDSLRTLGSAYVPCVLLVLAGSLAQGLGNINLSWGES